jgi:hypothetical protein
MARLATAPAPAPGRMSLRDMSGSVPVMAVPDVSESVYAGESSGKGTRAGQRFFLADMSLRDMSGSVPAVAVRDMSGSVPAMAVSGSGAGARGSCPGER